MKKADFLSSDLDLPAIFGIRSLQQLVEDYAFVLSGFARGSFQFFDLSSLKHLRPDLSIPAYLGYLRDDNLSPIVNLFDRVGGGKSYNQRVTKKYCLDFRGRMLTYDDHDGTDFVCPVGTPLVAAAPGVVTLVRDRWLRGGLTVTVDHGCGITTQYTHCSRVNVQIGEQVARGQQVALSGSSGIDMTTFFPLVPPHVHFMVWRYGMPIDCFMAENDTEENGTWLQKNDPRPPRQNETAFTESLVNEPELKKYLSLCRDGKIQKEIDLHRGNNLSLVALLEDSFHHDAYAWPEGVSAARLRQQVEGSVSISLPLGGDYQGACFADSFINEL